MKMAIGSDSVRAITDAISEYLEAKGVELVRCGALAGEKAERFTGEGLAKEIVDAWLATSPSDEPRRKIFHRKTDELDDEFHR